MTSNIGYKKNQVGFNEKSQNIITNEIKETLGIEFVNRIDKVLIFDRLNEASIKKIILKEIDKLRENFNFKTKSNRKYNTRNKIKRIWCQKSRKNNKR